MFTGSQECGEDSHEPVGSAEARHGRECLSLLEGLDATASETTARRIAIAYVVPAGEFQTVELDPTCYARVPRPRTASVALVVRDVCAPRRDTSFWPELRRILYVYATRVRTLGRKRGGSCRFSSLMTTRVFVRLSRMC